MYILAVLILGFYFMANTIIYNYVIVTPSLTG